MRFRAFRGGLATILGRCARSVAVVALEACNTCSMRLFHPFLRALWWFGNDFRGCLRSEATCDLVLISLWLVFVAWWFYSVFLDFLAFPGGQLNDGRFLGKHPRFQLSDVRFLEHPISEASTAANLMMFGS